MKFEKYILFLRQLTGYINEVCTLMTTILSHKYRKRYNSVFVHNLTASFKYLNMQEKMLFPNIQISF